MSQELKEKKRTHDCLTCDRPITCQSYDDGTCSCYQHLNFCGKDTIIYYFCDQECWEKWMDDELLSEWNPRPRCNHQRECLCLDKEACMEL